MLLAPRRSFQERPSLSPQGVLRGSAGKTQPRHPLSGHPLSARPALCGLQAAGGAVESKPLATHLSLPAAAGARTSCFRWRRSDGSRCCGCYRRLVLLLGRRTGCSAASSFVRFSCASSAGRRFPAPAAWAGSHGEAALRAGGFLGGGGGGSGCGRGVRPGPAQTHVWPALPRPLERLGTSAEPVAVRGPATGSGFPCAIGRTPWTGS